MKTFEFTEQEAELLRKEQYKYLINDNIDHFLLLVQQIISERITPEPGESGQSAEDVLFEVIWQKYGQNYDILADGYSGPAFAAILHPLILAAITTYASQVCADKEQEIDRINESLTVMVNRNAELEKELEYAKIR